MNDTLTQLLNRSSMPRLAEPAPDTEQLNRILRAGLLAPDHAYLRPTRLTVVAGAARERLGELFVQAAEASGTPLAEDKRQKMRQNPLRAPTIIVAACCPQVHDKVPEIEQIASTAAAVSLMQTAIDAMGYGSMWRTGDMAYHPLVKEAFGLTENDHLLAFLYVGTPLGNAKNRDAFAWQDCVKPFAE
ncbi:nitroreductase [Salinispirillum marinum]|uniref:Putative NAD(P)H nitroreductase n=2 Tax=Saccharospirillaceae TaxID=255527 RepID=A0ABV8BFK3_9GAMM